VKLCKEGSEFCENHCCESHTLLKDISEISPVLSTFLIQLGNNVVTRCSHKFIMTFMEIGSVKAILYSWAQ
jgi:hypothetical protein